MSQAFACSIDEAADPVTITVAGDLDLATAPAFKRVVRAAITRPGVGAVDVDLSCLQFVDSSGLREFVDASRLARDLEVRLTLTGAVADIQRTFVLVGLERLLELDTPPAGFA